MAADLRLQVLLSTIDNATKPLRAIMAGSKGTASALKAASDRLKQLNQAQRDVRGFRELKQATAVSNIALKQAQERLHALSAEMRGSDSVSKKLAKQHKAAKTAVGELTEKHALQQSKLNALRRTLDQSGYSTLKLAKHEVSLKSDILSANRALDAQKSRLAALAKAQQRMQKLHGAGKSLALHGGGALLAGQQMARGLIAPVAAFAQQEDAASQLKSSLMTAGGGVAPEFAKINALAEKLGNRLPGTTAELIEMMTMLRRQGISSQAILGGLGEATATLGAQLRIPFTEAAEFSAKLQDATRTTEGDMMALGDTIQRTFFLGVDANNMLGGFTKLSPALDTIRLSGLEATNALAPLLVMADQAGLKGESAGNAFRKVFQSALDLKKIGAANAKLKGTGINLDFTDGNGEFGGIDKLFAQLGKLKPVDTTTRLAVLKKIFGDDAETLQAVSLLINKGVTGYAEVQAKMAAQASLQDRVNAQLGTLSNLWEAATGTLTNVLAALGESIAPEIKSLVIWLGDVAAKAQVWAKENPRLAAVLLKTAAAVTALVVVLGGAALAVGTLLMPFAGLQFALTNAAPMLTAIGGAVARFGSGLMSIGARVLPWLIGAFRALTAALIANPIILVITAIATVIYLLWDNWDAVVGWVSDLMTDFADLLGGVWDWIKENLSWSPLVIVANNWDGILDYFAQFGDRIKAYLGGAWDAIVGIFTGDGGQVVDGLSTMFDAVDALFGGLPSKFLQYGQNMLKGLLDSLGGAWDWIKENLSWSPLVIVANNWDGILAYFASFGDRIKAYLGGAWDAIVGIFTGDGGRILGGLTTMFDAVNGLLGGLPAKFAQFGINMLQGLISGIGSMAGAVKDAVVNAASGAAGWFKATLGINSPSRVFAGFGINTMEGLAQGLTGGQSGPLAAVAAMAGRLKQLGAGLALGAGVALPAAAFDGRAPVASAPGAGGTVSAPMTVNITIQAAPGSDASAIAKAVRDELAKLDRERSSRRNARLSDID